MTTTLAWEPNETDADGPGSRPSWRAYVVPAAILVVVIAIVATGAGWWFLGGAHLHAYPPDGGATTTVGVPRNFGIELNSTGGAVQLVSAEPVSLAA